MSARSLAVFTGSQNESTAIRAVRSRALARPMCLAARQSDDYLFPFAAGDIGALYTLCRPVGLMPLSLSRVVNCSLGLQPLTGAHMVNSLTLGGRIFLSSLKPTRSEACQGRAFRFASLSRVGAEPGRGVGGCFETTRVGGAKSQSVLGAYLQGGDFVMNAVLGGAVAGQRRVASSGWVGAHWRTLMPH